MTGFFTRRLLALAVLLAAVTACTQKDCSKINPDLLAEIKYPQEVNARAAKLEDFPAELSVTLNPTHKLILRCRTESDFLHDRVLPGLMLWISDAWHFESDTSKLGKIFAEHKIGRWERTRTAGVLFNRFINDRPLQIDSLLADAAVRTAWAGRIKTTGALSKLSAESQRGLKQLIKTTDSLSAVSSRLELALTRTERLNKKTDERIALKNSMLSSLALIEDDYQYHASPENDIKLLGDSSVRESFGGFANRTAEEQALAVERSRVRVLTEEILFLRGLKTAPTR